MVLGYEYWATSSRKKCYIETTQFPPRKRFVRCKLVFKTKYKPNEIFIRKKYKLVIKSHKQQKGINYEKTFALVAKMTIVRTLLAVATIKD